MISLTALLSVGTLHCWLAAANAFNVPPGLLFAVAEVESSFRAEAMALAANGTHSVGLMQINSSWFPALERAGISETNLYDPCTNIHVGAWILGQNISRYGATWEAIGAYYAGPYDAKSYRWKLPLYRTYAGKVLKAWRRVNQTRSASDRVQPTSISRAGAQPAGRKP